MSAKLYPAPPSGVESIVIERVGEQTWRACCGGLFASAETAQAAVNASVLRYVKKRVISGDIMLHTVSESVSVLQWRERA